MECVYVRGRGGEAGRCPLPFFSMMLHDVRRAWQGAKWCNSWGDAEADFIGRASMGAAVDPLAFHYYSGTWLRVATMRAESSSSSCTCVYMRM